jgi:hypothetical protein
MNTELQNLTAEQRAALREMLLPDVRRWRAEDRLKDAKRRHDARQSDLAREQRKFAELEQTERRNTENRLAKMRDPLNRAESEAAEAQAELDAAAAELEAANG